MSLNHDIVGLATEPQERIWTSDQALLYAISVGAGQSRDADELAFTTENSIGVQQQVLPSFVSLLGADVDLDRMGDFDSSAYVHAQQSFLLHQPLAPSGRARSVAKVVGMYDKGSGALVVTESEVVDAESGAPLATLRSSLFIFGEGGFGGSRVPDSEWELPSGPPDATIEAATRPEQALLYRLNGDRNPLHSDPVFAARGGWSQPILHGMCTYGVVARVLLHATCESEPWRFRALEARFTAPVIPGADLQVEWWRRGADGLFRVRSEGTVVLDRGRIQLTS